MSTTRSSRTPNVRVLFTALAWLIVIATVFSVSAALSKGSTNNATGLITAATNVTALLFLMALRCPWLRDHAGVHRAGAPELLASWTMYRKEILRIAIYPTIGNLMMLFASDLSLYLLVARSGENKFGDALFVPLFAGVAVWLYALTAKAIRSMQRKAKSGAAHHPVLGVVLGSLLTVVISLLGVLFMALAGALTWQVLLPCAIAGATTFAAALITLGAVSTAKN
ncbi:hypothetical protein [Actinomadura citrea]|uniref:Uncharacterized protein n=1 Tax=Actinomadura citrea TaxID=46158 RepID=A0A7Y9G7P2_9ACTN|nr:hypothetical protein [Actinomadura citrea]NYE11429.1 hypothetical protein [Actinomadura citrea]GGT76355.1 hypothetical protein GCM10010177_38140 [Actinomadura citrea]